MNLITWVEHQPQTWQISKLANGKLTAVFWGGTAAVLNSVLAKNLAPLQAIAYLLLQLRYSSLTALDTYGLDLGAMARKPAT